MKGSFQMPPSINSMTEPSSAPTIGADATKSLDAGGQVFAQGLGAKRVPDETPGQPGSDSNVSSNPAGQTGGHPQNAPSRAPIQGSGMPDRSKNLAKLRGGKK
jgi:hypothetical protein